MSTKYINVQQPYVSSITLEKVYPDMIRWSALGDVDIKTAREFAAQLLFECDKLELRNKMKLEISDSSLCKKLTWSDAISYTSQLGDNWRLPTIAELELIYDSNNDFNNNAYWVNDGICLNPNYASYFDIGAGKVDAVNKIQKMYVRPVRMV